MINIIKWIVAAIAITGIMSYNTVAEYISAKPTKTAQYTPAVYQPAKTKYTLEDHMDFPSITVAGKPIAIEAWCMTTAISNHAAMVTHVAGIAKEDAIGIMAQEVYSNPMIMEIVRPAIDHIYSKGRQWSAGALEKFSRSEIIEALYEGCTN